MRGIMTITNDIWMPIYIGDYLADTMHLSAEEHGAYLLAIMHYWKSGGAFPKSQLQNICRCSDVTLHVTLTFFQEKDGFLHHKRIDKELARSLEARDKNKNKTANATAARLAKAKAGAEAKAKRNDVTTNVTLNVTKSQSQSQSQSQSPSKPKTQSNQEGDFLNFKGDLGFDFNILEYINLETDFCAHETARVLNLDYQALIVKFNNHVKGDPPRNNPDKAFLVWMKKYTDPIIVKRNRR